MTIPAWKQGLPPRPAILRFDDGKYYVAEGAANMQAAAERILGLESRLEQMQAELDASNERQGSQDDV